MQGGQKHGGRQESSLQHSESTRNGHGGWILGKMGLQRGSAPEVQGAGWGPGEDLLPLTISSPRLVPVLPLSLVPMCRGRRTSTRVGAPGSP